MDDVETCENKMLQRIRREENSIAAIHAVLNEAQRNNPTPFACKQGCAQCCHQLVTCMPLEAAEIKKYLGTLPRRQRDKIMDRAYRRAREWHEHQTLQPGSRTATAEQTMAVYDKWMGKPCPFLDDECRCTIYPVRPIDCRIHHSTTICQTPEWPDVKRLVSDAERWASNAIFNVEMDAGASGTTPLHAWILAKAL